MKKHLLLIFLMAQGLLTMPIRANGQAPRNTVVFALQVIEAAITEKGNASNKPAIPICGWNTVGAFIDSVIYYHNKDEMVLIQIHMHISSKGQPSVTKILILEDDGKTLLKGYMDQDYIHTIKSGLPKVCSWKPSQAVKGNAISQDIIIHLSLASDDYVKELNQSILEMNHALDLYDEEVLPPVPAPPPSPVKEEEPNDFIFFGEMYPTFGKNEMELQQYIKDHFIMPEDAQRFQIEGRILLTFVVNEDGSLSDVKPYLPVEKQLGYGLEEEGVRMLEQMPPWNPGFTRDKAVKVRMMLPIQIPQ
jgi:hypothetical protein